MSMPDHFSLATNVWLTSQSYVSIFKTLRLHALSAATLQLEASVFLVDENTVSVWMEGQNGGLFKKCVSEKSCGSGRQGTNLGLGVRPQQVTHWSWGGKNQHNQRAALYSIVYSNAESQNATVPESGGCLFLSIFLRSSKVTPSSLKSPPCITCKREIDYIIITH